MRLDELGETTLIERLIGKLSEATHPDLNSFGPSPRLQVGPGDDAAVWDSDAGQFLMTTDTMVEGIHFLPGAGRFASIGWRSMVANVSDIAAMGGSPLYATVTLGLPGTMLTEEFDDMYAGILSASSEYSVTIVGGDLVRSDNLFITIALTGRVSNQVLKRNAAKVGDLIAVTGSLGGSIGGLKLLSEVDCDQTDRDVLSLIESHLWPEPRIKEGISLSDYGVVCAMDVSDGLISDLTKLCSSSHVSAQVTSESVPVHPCLPKVFTRDFRQMALTSGEEYELVFTGSPSILRELSGALPSGFSVIGQIVGQVDSPSVFDSSGRHYPPEIYLGWDHFD